MRDGGYVSSLAPHKLSGVEEGLRLGACPNVLTLTLLTVSRVWRQAHERKIRDRGLHFIFSSLPFDGYESIRCVAARTLAEGPIFVAGILVPFRSVR